MIMDQRSARAGRLTIDIPGGMKEEDQFIGVHGLSNCLTLSQLRQVDSRELSLSRAVLSSLLFPSTKATLEMPETSGKSYQQSLLRNTITDRIDLDKLDDPFEPKPLPFNNGAAPIPDACRQTCLEAIKISYLRGLNLTNHAIDVKGNPMLNVCMREGTTNHFMEKHKSPTKHDASHNAGDSNRFHEVVLGELSGGSSLTYDGSIEAQGSSQRCILTSNLAQIERPATVTLYPQPSLNALQDMIISSQLHGSLHEQLALREESNTWLSHQSGNDSSNIISPSTASQTKYDNQRLPTIPQLGYEPLNSCMRLQLVMSESEVTQRALQEWDKQNGLPKSHSCTMVKTSRSRKQLQTGRILPKWDGTPLISSKDEEEAVISPRNAKKKRPNPD